MTDRWRSLGAVPWACLCERRSGPYKASQWADFSSAPRTAGSPPSLLHSPGMKTDRGQRVKAEAETCTGEHSALWVARPQRWTAASLCACRDEPMAAAGWLWSDQPELHWCGPVVTGSEGARKNQEWGLRWQLVWLAEKSKSLKILQIHLWSCQ